MKWDYLETDVCKGNQREETQEEDTHTLTHTHMLLANEADTKLPFAFLEVVYRKPRPSATAVSLQTDTQRDTQGDCVRNHLQL